MQREIDDPKLLGVTITRIEPSKAKQGMSIYVHRMDDAADSKDIVDRLNKMLPRFEHELRRALPKKRFPSLRFRWDEAFDKSSSVLEVLSQLERS